MESHFPITALTAETFTQWKTEIQVLLLDRGAWGFIDGTEPPIDATASRREVIDYNLRKGRAFSTIFFNAGEENRPLLAGVTDGKKAWQILEEHFEPPSRSRVAQLLDTFYSTRIQPGESMGIFLARLQKAARDLDDIGHGVEDKYQGYQAIRCLPPEYKGIVQIIYRYEDKDFKFSQIKSDLIAEEHRIAHMQRDYELNESTINVASTSTSVINNNVHASNVKPKKFVKVSQSKPTKVIGPCFKCNQLGHLIADCNLRDKPTAQTFKKGKNFKKSKNKNLSGQLAESGSGVVEEANLTEGDTKHWWVVDTAATQHFCKDRELFVKYKPIKNTSMTLAVGDVNSPIEGIGTVVFY
ncbi:hypothetical protein RF55_21751, partial [Lasius niger]